MMMVMMGGDDDDDDEKIAAGHIMNITNLRTKTSSR